MLNPFVGMLLVILSKMVDNVKDRESDFLVFIFITVYACLLQSTRIWDVHLPSDWTSDVYWGLFKEARTVPFYKYVFLSDKEPGWRLINYVGYYLTQGQYYPFANGIAIITIFLTCTSVYLYWKKIQADPIALIASLALIVFFSEYFGQINNLLRQFFALSLIAYVYVKKVISNRTNWWLLLLACLVHSFVFLFAIFLLIKPFYNVIKTKQLLQIGAVIIFALLVISKIAILKNMFLNVGFISYGIDRVAEVDNTIDQTDLGLKTIYITAIIVILVCIKMNNIDITNKYIVFYTNLLMFMMFICLSIALLAPEIMSRIYVSRFYFFPFVLPYFMLRNKFIHAICSYGIIIFFFFRFVLTFDQIRGGGFFPPLRGVITNSIFHFILS
jgi:hypothetical protein